MTIDDQIRAKLMEFKGARSMQELAEDTGLNVFTLYKILSGERGIGSATLGILRDTQPALVASIFLPEDSPSVHDNFPTGDEEPCQ